MKHYLVHYKEWAASQHWAIDGGWIKKSKVVAVESPLELNQLFEHIETITPIQ